MPPFFFPKLVGLERSGKDAIESSANGNFRVLVLDSSTNES